MIGTWDDLPLHQTPAPLAQLASSDPAAYERYWFGLCDNGGGASVGLVLNVHPNKGLVDAAFSVSDGESQVSWLVKDVMGEDRADLVCGPVRLTLTDPMRALRIRVDAEDVSADVTFKATTPAIEEARVTRTRAGRVVQDRTRYVQLGRVSGRVSSRLGRVTLTEDTWFGGRDHSWGIWDAPREHASEVHTAAARKAPPSFFWLIGAFDDWAVQAVTHAEGDGRPYGEYAAVAPTFAAGADPTGPGARQQSRPVVGVETSFTDGTWHVASATVALGAADPSAPPEQIRLEAVHAVLPRSVGYDHPSWLPGQVPAALPEVVVQTLVPAELDLGSRENHRALQFVRMTRADGAVGVGVVDQCVAGSVGRPLAPGS